jgi:DNA repair exonuclease SbcCD ATPase subunit
MDHNTDQELLQPFTCTALFTCPKTPETQTTPAPIGSELGVLGVALKRVKEKRAQKQTAPAFPESDAQHEHALAQASASLAEREQALAKREHALRLMHESLVEKSRRQEAHEKLLHQMQTVIEESNRKVIARDIERKENQEKLDAQKNKQDEMMEALKDWGAMCQNRSAALDERERILETTSREQETRVNAIQQAFNTVQEKMDRLLEAGISECAGYEERAQACAELAHLRGVGLDALEAAELRELQGVVQRTSRLLERALVRRAAESEVIAAQNEFMCPIGHDLMREPVSAADGHTYERRHIERLFALKAGETLRSPMTNAELTKTDLYPNHALKSMIERAVDAKVDEINAR